MIHKHQFIWFLEDYQSFLKHPEPMIRQWAARCIEEQYSHLAAESFVNLLTDPDPHLQITAARAIGNSGDPSYEPALLAVWPESEGSVRSWFTATLGRLRSPTLLPQLVADLDVAPAHHPSDETQSWSVSSIVDALGRYPDEVARSALWRFVERYRKDDRLTYTAFRGLLRFADPDTLPRLVQYYGQLKPYAANAWEHAAIALAEVVEVGSVLRDLIKIMSDSPDDMILLLDEWLGQVVPYSETFEAAIDEAVAGTYAGLLPHILTELERVVAERNDDLPTWLEVWRSGERPGGYRWRMLYAYHLITTLVEHPPADSKQYQDMVALGMTLLGQTLTDQDDEAMLQTAPNELIRQVILFDILESPRMHILPDVVEQVVALGPGAVPHLINILEGHHFWALSRALQTLTRIAQAHPGAADAAVPTILDLMDSRQADEVMEAAGDALVAIGPGVIAPAAEKLGWVDSVYDIYVCAALSNIPTRASAEAMLDHLAAKQTIAEYEAEALAALGHPVAIPYLRDHYEWSDDPLLCTVLYKLALLNNYAGSELAEWRAVALEYEAEAERRLAEMKTKHQSADNADEKQ
jgi:HEAT repeat protein